MVANTDPAFSATRGWASFVSRSRGPLLVLLSQILFGLLNAAVKTLVSDPTSPINPVEILSARMIITLALSSTYCWWQSVPDFPLGPVNVRWLMILRAVGGTFGATGFYFSLEYLPMGEATVLNLLAPLASCCFMAIFLGRGHFSSVHAIAAVASLGSVILMARPSSLFPDPALEHRPQTELRDRKDEERLALLLGFMFALIGAGGGACAYTSIRLIGTRAHPLVSVNYFALAVVTVTSIAMITGMAEINTHLTITQVALLCSTGILSFVTEFLLSTGLAVEKSSAATQMILSQVLFATFLDWIIWRVVPTLTEIIGGTVMVLSLGAVLLQSSGSAENDGVSQVWMPWGRHARTVHGPASQSEYDLESLVSDDDEESKPE